MDGIKEASRPLQSNYSRRVNYFTGLEAFLLETSEEEKTTKLCLMQHPRLQAWQ